MSEDLRVTTLVRDAAPTKSRIRDVLERCAITGRKHTYTIVAGGAGAQKESIGLILNVCPNTRGSQCTNHLKPIKVQMSIANRSGLLLNLATLDPPPFGSEDFVHWCCQATMSLVARDVQALRAAPTLAPGSFLAFTPSIPGMDDLPRMRDSLLRHPAQAVTRLTPVVVKDGEEVNVVVMIYEMDRVGPFRIVAKGKKMGALVGFTFRQPAILQALGVRANSRDLGAYLMYEPFQQAWTKTLKPSQTLTLCEGGGVMYRHPRVKVTLWLDRYVKDIYPDWVRNGARLPDLVALATDSFPARARTNVKRTAPAKPNARQPDDSGARNIAPGRVQETIPSVASPRPALTVDKSVDSLAKNPRPPCAQKLVLAKPGLALIKYESPDLSVGSSPPAMTVTDSSRHTNTKESAGRGKDGVAHGVSKSKGSIVIDLTGESSGKRKRSLSATVPKVDDDALGEEHNMRARRRRRIAAKVRGKGTAEDPYVL